MPKMSTACGKVTTAARRLADQRRSIPPKMRIQLRPAERIIQKYADLCEEGANIRQTRELLSALDTVDRLLDGDAGAPPRRRVRSIQPPRITKRLKLGSQIIFRGDRGAVGFDPATRDAVYKKTPKNAQNHLYCPICKQYIADQRNWTIDHIRPWALAQGDVRTVFFCYLGYHFSAHTRDDIVAEYNRKKNLRFTCRHCNSGKGGVKNIDLNGPQPAHPCPDGGDCDLPKPR